MGEVRSGSTEVKVGDHFIHMRPAPGYPPYEAIVQEVLRDGWVKVKHYPGTGTGPHRVVRLTDPKHYRRVTIEDFCEAADGLTRPCLVCPGCARWEHRHTEREATS